MVSIDAASLLHGNNPGWTSFNYFWMPWFFLFEVTWSRPPIVKYVWKLQRLVAVELILKEVIRLHKGAANCFNRKSILTRAFNFWFWKNL